MRGKFAAFAELLDNVESAARVSPYDALRVVLDGGLRASFSDDQDRVANLDELLAAAKSFGPHKETRPSISLIFSRCTLSRHLPTRCMLPLAVPPKR